MGTKKKACRPKNRGKRREVYRPFFAFCAVANFPILRQLRQKYAQTGTLRPSQSDYTFILWPCQPVGLKNQKEIRIVTSKKYTFQSCTISRQKSRQAKLLRIALYLACMPQKSVIFCSFWRPEDSACPRNPLVRAVHPARISRQEPS